MYDYSPLSPRWWSCRRTLDQVRNLPSPKARKVPHRVAPLERSEEWRRWRRQTGSESDDMTVALPFLEEEELWQVGRFESVLRNMLLAKGNVRMEDRIWVWLIWCDGRDSSDNDIFNRFPQSILIFLKCFFWPGQRWYRPPSLLEEIKLMLKKLRET